jgi:predicted nuclease of restriction endonuclease-like RecB superfamily
VTPTYVVEHDHRWLRALIDEFERFCGRRRAEVLDRLRDPLPVAAPLSKLRVAITVLDSLYRGRAESIVPARRARKVLFAAAARARDHEQAVTEAAATLRCKEHELLESVFADLPSERLVATPARAVTPSEVAERCNLAIVASLMRHALEVSVVAEGQLRPLVRLAKLRGLLCTVSLPSERGVCCLDISGPYSLFKSTTMYGRALAQLVPELASCYRAELRARIASKGPDPVATLVIRAGDPILPPAERRAYDSSIERRFSRDFGRAAPGWDLVREPAAIEAQGSLIFPDFLLRRRSDPDCHWFLEIAGFWTPEYIRQKLAKLRAAAIPNLILCLDEARNCGDDELPRTAHVVRYRSRVDAQVVLALIEPGPLRLGPQASGADATSLGRRRSRLPAEKPRRGRAAPDSPRCGTDARATTER